MSSLYDGKPVPFDGVMQETFWQRDGGFISLESALSSQREEVSGRLRRHGMVPICRHKAITFIHYLGPHDERFEARRSCYILKILSLHYLVGTYGRAYDRQWSRLQLHH